MGEYSSTRDVKMPSQSIFQTLAPGDGRCSNFFREFRRRDGDTGLFSIPTSRVRKTGARGQDDVRTFCKDSGEESEIPIYDIPLLRGYADLNLNTYQSGF